MTQAPANSARRPLSRRRPGAGRMLRIGWRALRRVDINARIRLLHFGARLWGEGFTVRLVVVSLAAVVLMASSTITWLSLPSTVILPAVFFIIAWSAGLAAAAALAPLPILLLASVWLVFYHAQVTGWWIGTPVGVLAPAWVGWLVCRRCASLERRAAGLASWLLIAAGLSYVMAGPSGIRRWLDWGATDARLLVWMVLAMGGAIGFSRARRLAPPAFAPAFWGSSLVSFIVLLPGLLDSRTSLADSLQLVFADAAAIVVLFWLWTSGRATAGAMRLAAWLLRYAGRLLPADVVISGAPMIILGLLVASHLGPPASHDPLLQVVDDLRVWTGLIAVGVLIWWRMRGSITRERVLLVGAWWWAGGALLNGIIDTSRSLISSHTDRLPLSGIAVAFVAVGLLMQLAGLSTQWATEGRARVLGVFALTTIFVASAVALSLHGNAWETVRLMTVMVGMLHLGLPLAAYETLMLKRRSGASLEASEQIQMVAAGYAAGLLTVLIAPQSVAVLILDAAVLSAALAWLRSRHPQLQSADGSFAGILFASGLIAAWMHPQMPTIPFMPSIRLPLDVVVDKPLLSMQHVRVLAAAWATGAACGAVLFAWWRPRD